MNVSAITASYKGKMDATIITIRDDDYLAVLQRFSDRHAVRGRNIYEVTSVGTLVGVATVAVYGCRGQANSVAQTFATNLLDDLARRSLLVVGIAGGRPFCDTGPRGPSTRVRRGWLGYVGGTPAGRYGVAADSEMAQSRRARYRRPRAQPGDRHAARRRHSSSYNHANGFFAERHPSGSDGWHPVAVRPWDMPEVPRGDSVRRPLAAHSHGCDHWRAA